MRRIEKTVFISYRRTNIPWALAIYQHLTSQGYDVFFDYLSIPSGDFEQIILDNIRSRAHFIVILTPSALERCHNPGDWLRREIETALDEKRNIVPLMLESFDFGSPATVKALTGKLEGLKRYNALRVPSEYFFEAMDRLRTQYLNVELEAVIHPVSEDVRQVTEEHQVAASEAKEVKKTELTAQEWFERGYVFQTEAKNFAEAIRCYSEAIRRKPDLAEAYANRGNARRANQDLQGALADYSEAIRLKPDYAEAYVNRGISHQRSRNLDDAAKDYKEAIRLNPGVGSVRSSLMSVLRKLGRRAEAEEQEKLARELISKEMEYDQACFEAICGNVERALELLKIGLEKGQSTREWAQDDPDFESIRDDPRFKKIVRS